MRRILGLTACLVALAAAPAGAQDLQLSFGGPGEGAGQLDFPAGVTIHPRTGHVFVAEFDNDRISEFEPDGAFVKAFGLDVVPGGGTGPEVCLQVTGCQAGSSLNSAGGVNAPSAIFASPAGDLYVTELDAERVTQFKPDGELVVGRGWDVVPGGDAGYEHCDLATGCKGGITGAGAGQFAAPAGVHVTSGGAIYVADNQNPRITLLSPGGVAWLMGHDVTAGGGTGFEVCDLGLSPTPSCQQGVAGGAAGQFSAPRGVVLDRGRRLAVVDMASRVSQFDVDDHPKSFNAYEPPAFRQAWGRDVVPGGATAFEICTPATGCQTAGAGSGAGELSTPRGAIAAAPNGDVLAADTGNDRVNRYGPDGAFAGSFGEGVVDDPRGLAVDCHGGIWVGDGGASGQVHRFAVAGTPLPPCPFDVKRIRRNRDRGTAKLIVQLPSAGTVSLVGRQVVNQRRAATVSQRVKLRVRPSRRTAKKLRRKGTAKIRPKLVFRDGGSPRRKRPRVKLVRRG